MPWFSWIPGTPCKSGKYWVAWANQHAVNSDKIEDLSEPFRSHVKAFKTALEDAGAKVEVTTTRRSPARAYLFHWSWRIALGKAKAASAPARKGVPIQWDHGTDAANRAGAMEMVKGFGLAVPPKSTNAPSLQSNHITGTAIDMDIQWTGEIQVKKKDGKWQELQYMSNVNKNTKLHEVGASYGVRKLVTDAPHWSSSGR